jgi:hypothetical protein
MNLLEEIQSLLLEKDGDIAPVLLRLQILASRLNSGPLADWVKHESSGYPSDAPIPTYRELGISYTGTFSGPFGSGIRNAPIAPYLVKKFAGEQWVTFSARQSIAAIDDLIKSSEETGTLRINASNLILLLQGKVYEDYACNEVVGNVSRAALVELRHAVRARILAFVLQLEATVPEASAVTIKKGEVPSASASSVTTNIANQVIYGTVGAVSAGTISSQTNVSIGKGDQDGLIKSLLTTGMSQEDAESLGEAIAADHPGSKDEPLGKKASTWLAGNLKKAAGGVWKMGIAAATKVVTEAALRFYGLG